MLRNDNGWNNLASLHTIAATVTETTQENFAELISKGIVFKKISSKRIYFKSASDFLKFASLYTLDQLKDESQIDDRKKHFLDAVDFETRIKEQLDLEVSSNWLSLFGLKESFTSII